MAPTDDDQRDERESRVEEVMKTYQRERPSASRSDGEHVAPDPIPRKRRDGQERTKPG